MSPFDLIDLRLKDNNNIKRFWPTNYFITSSSSNINLILIISFSSSYLISLLKIYVFRIQNLLLVFLSKVFSVGCWNDRFLLLRHYFLVVFVDVE